jgi:serine/threonine-protein kinase
VAKIARAVEYAHEHGVLHRDLKPGNILLDGRGEPLVTDFGLAKWLDAGANLTRTLTIFGTPGYIAPEQARGPAAHLTAAADVYSLGAIAFDLFTGRPPFLGEHALAVVQQATEKSAPKLRSIAPTLDRDLETICARALEREPQARYRRAGDLAADLENWLGGRPITARRVLPPARIWRWTKRNPKLAATTAGAFCSATAAALLLFSRNGPLPHPDGDSGLRAMSAEVKTMAVLPLKVINADASDEYLGVGLADALTTQIGRVPEILIRSTPDKKYAEKHAPDPVTMGRLLRVEAVLEGTVQRTGDQIGVTARLYRVADGTVLWSGNFNEKFANVFAIEDAISQSVAKALIHNVSAEDRKLLTTRHTDNADAYRAYLKGRYVWNRRTPAALQQSLEFFRQALDLDPTYSSAYAGMADAYALLVWQEQLPRDEFIGRAKATAIKALEIDQTLAEPHASLGYVKFWYDWDFEGAEREFRRAIELNPDYGTAHHWYGEALGMMGRFEDGVKELQLARQVDPLSPIISADLGKLFFLARQPDKAIEELQKALELDPDLPLAHVFLGLAYNKKGLRDKAAAELERIAMMPGSRAIFKATLGFVYGQSGRVANARNILSELLTSRSSKRYVSPFHIALVYVGLGENDKAIEWLETAKQERDPFLMYIPVDPNFDSLRGDARFSELLSQISASNQSLP